MENEENAAQRDDLDDLLDVLPLLGVIKHALDLLLNRLLIRKIIGSSWMMFFFKDFFFPMVLSDITWEQKKYGM